MELSFLTPSAALIGLTVMLPLAALWIRERRFGQLRRAIGLEPPARPWRLGRATALAAVFGLLALAAAQPAVRTVTSTQVRTDAQVFVALDTTGSMAASAARGAPTRFERASDFAVRLRSGLPDIPVGVASLTNRALPHLFPTADQSAFASTVAGAVGINRPPPRPDVFLRSSSFEPLAGFADENFFSTDSVERLVVLLSDGESQLFPPRTLASKLEEGGVQLIVVRFWDADERIWFPSGRPDPGYATNPASQAPVEELASITAGGRVYEEDELSEVLEGSRAYLGEGPLQELESAGGVRPLAVYLIAATALPLAFLFSLGLSLGAPRRGRAVLHTVWSSPWPGFVRKVRRRSSRAQASPRPS
jgi:hypothetical protein